MIIRNNSNINSINFKTNPTEIFSKNFICFEKEIKDIFQRFPESKGIAGTLPPYWLAKLEGKTIEERNYILQKVFQLFHSAIKHLKPYNADKKQFKQERANMENKRIKEASKYLTEGLRHFGILSKKNQVILKRLKVKGSYTKRAYQLHEKGEHPTLEKIFIKLFNSNKIFSNSHGKYSELAHGLYINNCIKENCVQRFYWGDTEAGFIASEYLLPPKHVSPVVNLNKVYKSKSLFAKDFFHQTGIRMQDLENYGIDFGKINSDGSIVPHKKEEIVGKYLHAVLEKNGLRHLDLHNENAMVGTNMANQPIVKITDIGGIIKA